MHQNFKTSLDALKLVTEISPTLINSRLVLDIWISDTVPQL